MEFPATFQKLFQLHAFPHDISGRLVDFSQQQVQFRKVMPFIQLDCGLGMHFRLGQLIEMESGVRSIVKRIRVADRVQRQSLLR